MKVLINIEANSGKPIYRQIVDEVVEAIASGYLKGGEKLPSTRDLGRTLGISRFTVMRSYEDLASAGYVKIATGSGAYVSNEVRSPEKAPMESVPEALREARPAALSHCAAQALRASRFEVGAQVRHGALNNNLTEMSLLPVSRWKEVFYNACRDVQNTASDKTLPKSLETDAWGRAELREVLVEYLNRSRRVRATVDRLMVFTSWQSAYDFVLRLIVDAGDSCAVETPGMTALYRTLLATGASVHPVNMDAEGMSARHLEAIEGELKLICVNSARHEPTGLSMSVERRQEILALAKGFEAYVIENDRNHEFKYGQKQLPSLQGMDTSDSVIYIGTVADVMAPLSRLAYIVLPEHLVEAAEALKQVSDPDCAPIDQLALAHFIAGGHYERHIKRTAEVYAERRAALVHALTTKFGERIKVVSAGGGTNIVVRFHASIKAIDIELAIAQLSLPVVSAAQYYPVQAESDHYLIGFGQHTAQQLADKVAAFAAYIAQRQANAATDALREAPADAFVQPLSLTAIS